MGVSEGPLLACRDMLTCIAFCVSALEQDTFNLINNDATNFQDFVFLSNHISRVMHSQKRQGKSYVANFNKYFLQL